MKVSEILEITDNETLIQLNRLYDPNRVECSGTFTKNGKWVNIAKKIEKYLDRDIESMEITYGNILQIFISDRNLNIEEEAK